VARRGVLALAHARPRVRDRLEPERLGRLVALVLLAPSLAGGIAVTVVALKAGEAGWMPHSPPEVGQIAQSLWGPLSWPLGQASA
jgi:hypothetical protein